MLPLILLQWFTQELLNFCESLNSKFTQLLRTPDVTSRLIILQIYKYFIIK